MGKKKVNPNKLVRGNWYVFKYQMQQIKQLAKKEGVSESEIIRELIANKS